MIDTAWSQRGIHYLYKNASYLYTYNDIIENETLRWYKKVYEIESLCLENVI